MSKVIFVGGFGASKYYSEAMCHELQRLMCIKVLNFSIHHGMTLDEECCYIISSLTKDYGEVTSTQAYIVTGFSTGCVIAMALSKYLNKIDKIILINPGELMTRMNRNILDSMVNETSSLVSDYKEYRNIYTFLPILKSEGLSVTSWKLLWLSLIHI